MDSFRHRILLFLFVSGICTGLPEQPVFAQQIDSTSQSSYKTNSSSLQNPHEFAIWMGMAFDSFSLWGKTPDAKNQTLGIGYNRKILPIHDTILEYNFRLDLYSNYSYPDFNNDGQRNSHSGLGVSPLGFQLNFLSSKAVQPFLKTSAGVIFLDSPFPDFRGKKLNFTLRAGTGLEINLSPSVSLAFGITYHHLSNGERGEVNPGIDSNVCYAAITIF